jgi:transcriptional regulator with XRE-family HTH domain
MVNRAKKGAERSLRDLLRRRLEQLDISQVELARRAGFNAQYISDILTGKKHSVRRDAVFQLALALQVSPLVLYRTVDPSFGEEKPVLYTDKREIAGPTTNRLFSEEALAAVLPAKHRVDDVFPVLQNPLTFDERKLLGGRLGRGLQFYPWPATLGPANGGYGLAHPENPLRILPGLLLAAPERPIKVGDLFIGFVIFAQSRPTAWIFWYRDSDRDFFYLNVDASEGTIKLPRTALARAHRVAAVLQQGQDILPIKIHTPNRHRAAVS